VGNLFRRSIEIIQAGQTPSGAYLASPTFSQYQASWMRDGGLIAFGMDCAGQYDSSRRFFEWAVQTLRRYTGQVDLVLDKLARNLMPAEEDYLPTRFTPQGERVPGAWWDFQLDGYGTWLWSLVEHVERTGDHSFYQDNRPIVASIVNYLAALWRQPNYDCWEENRDQVHVATLAAIYGGLHALARLDPTLHTAPIAEQIRAFVLEHGIEDGKLVKFLGNPAVDGSLLWAAVPYGLLNPDDPIFEATLNKIERDLHYPGGGVYRYLADVYYGGGEWLLLAAWLGWVYAVRGERARASAISSWIEAQSGEQAHLPEQVSDRLLAPAHYQAWVDKWGSSANPLLWSHAMYLVLFTALNGSTI
jgi:GH15 family glucan-1,4-alpha-glucosidase